MRLIPERSKYYVYLSEEIYWVAIKSNAQIRIPFHKHAHEYETSDEDDPKYYWYWHDDTGEDYFYQWTVSYSITNRKEIKRMYTTSSTTSGVATMNSLADFMNMVYAPAKTCEKAKQSKLIDVQEDTMNTVDTHDTNARRLLHSDLRELFYAHDRDLERKFHLRDDPMPKSPEEALERIKSGKFELRHKDSRSIFDTWDTPFRWRDPEAKEDHEGYKAARAKLDKSYKHAQQDVTVDPLDKAKAAVRTFEKETFH